MWTPAAVAELINDVGSWIFGLIFIYQLARGLRTLITGK